MNHYSINVVRGNHYDGDYLSASFEAKDPSDAALAFVNKFNINDTCVVMVVDTKTNIKTNIRVFADVSYRAEHYPYDSFGGVKV